MNIHRYYEKHTEDIGFLHDIAYNVIGNGKTIVNSLQTHLVKNNIVADLLSSHQDPMDNVMKLAAYSILFGDKVIDMEGNYIL
jgi:hypothetical protein